MDSPQGVQPEQPSGAGKTVKAIVSVWMIAALAVTVSGLFAKIPIPGVQATIAALTLMQLLAFVFWRGFREWTFSLDLKNLTLFQSWRVLPGAAFLYYFYVLGKLPYDFAIVGGYGDILVAITAPFASKWANSSAKSGTVALLVWQILALGDLAMVIKAALQNGLADPESMQPLLHFPMALLPTIMVPLTLFVHFISIAQLQRKLRS